jgi:hypothetical protein
MIHHDFRHEVDEALNTFVRALDPSLKALPLRLPRRFSSPPRGLAGLFVPRQSPLTTTGGARDAAQDATTVARTWGRPGQAGAVRRLSRYRPAQPRGALAIHLVHVSRGPRALCSQYPTSSPPALTDTLFARFQHLSHKCDRRRESSTVPSLSCTQADLPMAVFFPRREKIKDEVSYARKIIGVV